MSSSAEMDERPGEPPNSRLKQLYEDFSDILEGGHDVSFSEISVFSHQSGDFQEAHTGSYQEIQKYDDEYPLLRFFPDMITEMNREEYLESGVEGEFVETDDSGFVLRRVVPGSQILGAAVYNMDPVERVAKAEFGEPVYEGENVQVDHEDGGNYRIKRDGEVTGEIEVEHTDGQGINDVVSVLAPRGVGRGDRKGDILIGFYDMEVNDSWATSFREEGFDGLMNREREGRLRFDREEWEVIDEENGISEYRNRFRRGFSDFTYRTRILEMRGRGS